MSSSDPPVVPWTERSANRSAVQEEIVRELGERRGGTVRLRMAPEVRRTIDERRIIEDDLRRVVDRAEATGKRLRNEQSGRYLACHQPDSVAFWVEYDAVLKMMELSFKGYYCSQTLPAIERSVAEGALALGAVGRARSPDRQA